MIDHQALFWQKVDKQPDGCWFWTGYRIKRGYGMLTINQRQLLAHRVAYEWLVGPIPQGLQLDHLCRVTNCVNPEHLEPVTNAENARRAALAYTHCCHGHLYDAENTIITRTGAKACRKCHRIRNAEYRKHRELGRT